MIKIKEKQVDEWMFLMQYTKHSYNWFTCIDWLNHAICDGSWGIRILKNHHQGHTAGKKIDLRLNSNSIAPLTVLLTTLLGQLIINVWSKNESYFLNLYHDF